MIMSFLCDLWSQPSVGMKVTTTWLHKQQKSSLCHSVEQAGILVSITDHLLAD